MFRLVFVVCLLLSLLVPAVGQEAGSPVESRPTEARNQKPAFPGQTRAPGLVGSAYRVEVVSQGLEFPWGLAFLPDGRALVTERPGRLRLVSRDGGLSAPLKGVPAVVASGQAGLLDVVLDPEFPANRRVYLSYVEPQPSGFGIAVVRARLDDASVSLTQAKVIFRANPAGSSTANLGSRLVFGRDGRLFVTVGDRYSQRDLAQSLASDLGKVVRITTDGEIPADNPLVGTAGARGELWSWGHRNPQGAAIDPQTGQLWTVEHGARGGDEVNLIVPGKNYGWPIITYGIDYSGAPVGDGLTQKAGLEQPVYYWDPVIAPSGLAFYTGELFPAWKGNLFVGGLRGMHLARLVLQNGRVVGEERLLTDLGERIRDVVVGPDGALYLLTDNAQGRILRVVPR